jgi:tetratricopeptide (TPR) repeat protein
MTRIAHLRWQALVLAATCSVALAREPAQTPVPSEADPIASIFAWQVDEAEQALTLLRAGDDPVDPTLDASAEMLIAFHRGDYAAAKSALERHPRPASLAPYDTLVPAAAERRAEVVEQRSEHFIARVEAGAHELLLPYALDTLEKAWKAIGEVFDYYPEGPILVELFKDKDSFIELSTLSEDQVRRSGTIALCKWDHMLVVSPRALAAGYPWRDTLTHEYTHLVISRLSRNQAPVWFHEGTAAYMEELWQSSEGGKLSATGEALLARALEEDGLVPFEVINRSMPNLPDAGTVSLAFAEVTTAIDFLIQTHGRQSVRKAIDLMRGGLDADEAIARLHGTSFDRWERDWLSWVRGQSLRKRVDVAAYELAFASDDIGGGEPTDPVLRGDDQAMNFARLGDLLRERGRYDAALVEYGKAAGDLESHSPGLSNRHAQTLLELGRPADARAILLKSVEKIPTYVHSWVRLARAEQSLGNRAEELRAWRRARDLNPFHPAVHPALLQLLEEGDPEHARSKNAQQLLAKEAYGPRHRSAPAAGSPAAQPETERTP